MTATDELRRLLDERGVKHNDPAEWLTYWHDTDGHVWSASEMSTGLLSVSTAGVGSLTPEQAISATLGESPRLPHFWTHDGTLHVELPKLPESISVRLPAQRDREVGSARVWQYTRGVSDAVSARQGDAGTCRKVYLVETSDDLLESWFPLAVYLHREAAEDCAEALRKENDGIQQFARVSELKVVDE